MSFPGNTGILGGVRGEELKVRFAVGWRATAYPSRAVARSGRDPSSSTGSGAAR